LQTKIHALIISINNSIEADFIERLHVRAELCRERDQIRVCGCNRLLISIVKGTLSESRLMRIRILHMYSEISASTCEYVPNLF